MDINPFQVFLKEKNIVLNMFQRIGEFIEASENHPFVVNGMIVNSSKLKIGDELTTTLGQSKIIKIKDLRK